jgi:hypothetical protein
MKEMIEDMAAWLVVLFRRAWIVAKFYFRNAWVRFERAAFLARLFNVLRHGTYTDEEFTRIIPALSENPSAVLRWVREVRDVTFYLGHRFERKMAIYIVRECQELMRNRFLNSDTSELVLDNLHDMKRGLYKLAKQIRSVMTPVAISESANFLINRMHMIIHRTITGNYPG